MKEGKGRTERGREMELVGNGGGEGEKRGLERGLVGNGGEEEKREEGKGDWWGMNEGKRTERGRERGKGRRL